MQNVLQRSVPFSFTSVSKAITWVVISIGVCGLLYFGHQAVNPTTIETVTTKSIVKSSDEPVEAYALPRSEPVKLQVESVGINSDVVQVGLNAEGAVHVPYNPVLTGWYKHSPTPGEIGPAIIAGHVDTKAGPAVFWRLGEIKPGEIIAITRVDDTVIRFQVMRVQQYSQSAFPTEEVYGNTAGAELRLITCSGTYDRTAKAYTHNTVVFAKLLK